MGVDERTQRILTAYGDLARLWVCLDELCEELEAQHQRDLTTIQES